MDLHHVKADKENTPNPVFYRLMTRYGTTLNDTFLKLLMSLLIRFHALFVVACMIAIISKMCI